MRVCMHLSLGALGAHLSCFIERGYLTVLELTDWNELAGLSLPSQSWDYQPCDRTPPTSKHGFWELNSVSLACTTNCVLTELVRTLPREHCRLVNLGYTHGSGGVASYMY